MIDLFISVKYFHLVSVFTLVSMVVAENIVVRPKVTAREFVLLGKLDALYGITSITTLTAGFLLWFAIGKGAQFYVNYWLYLKLGIFTIVGVLSIWPTIYFIRNKPKGESALDISIPKYIRILLRIEIILLAIIPLLAILVAQGKGQF